MFTAIILFLFHFNPDYTLDFPFRSEITAKPDCWRGR